MLRFPAALALGVSVVGLAHAQTVPPTATEAAPAPAKPGEQQATAASTPAKPTPAEFNAKVTAPLPAEGAGSPRSPCGTTARRCCRGPCTLARPSSSPVPHAGHHR